MRSPSGSHRSTICPASRSRRRAKPLLLRELKRAVDDEIIRASEIARLRRTVRSVLDDFVAVAATLGPDRPGSGASLKAWIRGRGGSDEVLRYDELCAFALIRIGARAAGVHAAFERGDLNALEIACGAPEGARGRRPDLEALPGLVYATLDLLDPFRSGDRAAQASDFVDTVVEHLSRIEQELAKERSRPPAPATLSVPTLRSALGQVTSARA